MITRHDPIALRDRYRGCLLGLAAGDALGTTLEFTPHLRGGRPPVTTIVGGGPFHLPKGAWTDDTSMALCLADSLLDKGDLEPRDVLDRWVRWWRHGENSSTGRCFDVGGTTSAALHRYAATGELYAAESPTQAGNGPLMRVAPVPMAVGPERLTAAAQAALLQAGLTHGSELCGDACAVFSVALCLALGGAGKERALDVELLRGLAFTQEVQLVAGGSYRTKGPDQVHGSGYVVDCLEAALWAVWHTQTYREAVLAAANLGEDADTTAAVAGALAGALYGEQEIPQHWRSTLVQADGIRARADGLLELAARLDGWALV